MKESFYTTHEVSKFCDVYPTTVINWINEGMLPAFTTPGGHRRVRKSDLVRLMQKNNMPLPEELSKEEETRVLVIDDDVKILRMIKTILQSEEDIKVITTSDGFQAGVIVSEWTPDIILLDMLMPGIDGFEVCRQLRRNDKTKEIPIIAVTVLRDEKQLKKMYACGITDYLAKPFKSGDLIEKIRSHLNVLQK